MDWEYAKIIDSNGQKYRVGWDEHGYFRIEYGEVGPDGEFYPGDGGHTYTLTPTAATHVMHVLEEGPP